MSAERYTTSPQSTYSPTLPLPTPTVLLASAPIAPPPPVSTMPKRNNSGPTSPLQSGSSSSWRGASGPPVPPRSILRAAPAALSAQPADLIPVPRSNETSPKSTKASRISYPEIPVRDSSVEEQMQAFTLSVDKPLPQPSTPPLTGKPHSHSAGGFSSSEISFPWKRSRASPSKDPLKIKDGATSKKSSSGVYTRQLPSCHERMR